MKRILIADDEPHLVRVLKLGLEKAGYSVSAVNDGKQALEKIRESLPDVLITDIEMPRMNGEQLCRYLNDKLSDHELLVIVVTSHPDDVHREWSGEIPGIKFLEKPLSLRRLNKILDAHFARLGDNGADD